MRSGGTLTLAAANLDMNEEETASPVEAQSGHFVELSVSDTGVGMTPEVQAHLFEPFFTTKKLGQGAGMGLAMVYGIVKAHKGWVSVQSTPDQGSTFRLYLPALESGVRSPESAARPTSRTPDRAACVLVV